MQKKIILMPSSIPIFLQDFYKFGEMRDSKQKSSQKDLRISMDVLVSEFFFSNQTIVLLSPF